MVNVSELHKRLSHLVNYSSQLIFVSADSIGSQQKTLNEFLSSQRESTEISFFTASTEKQNNHYRGEICRQLAGHEVGTFMRPLAELLNASSSRALTPSGSYLVCITNAQDLSDTFLQELWDWVMHCDQTNPGVHLNIILFGQSRWAKRVQEWLPMQNSHKPILLSSELVNPVGFDVNALEALIEDKTSWFGASNQPIVTNKWFISSVLSLFLIVFASLMAWQYPAQFSKTATFLLPQNILQNGDDVNDETLIGPPVERSSSLTTEDKQFVIFDEQLSKTINTEARAPLPLASANVVSSQEISKLENVNTAQTLVNINTTNSITDTLLVTNWPDSVSASNEVFKNTLNHLPNTVASPIEQISAPNKTRVLNVTPLINEEDFEVPDILSAEQLSVTLANKDGIDTEQTLTFPSKVLESTQGLTRTSANIAKQSTQIPAISDSAIDYRFDETTLLQLPTFSILLQISGIQDPDVLENYLNSNNLKDSTWVYETRRYGNPWYVVLYRQSFESVDSALKQVTNLPGNLKEAQPFAKSISQIQREINQRAI